MSRMKPLFLVITPLALAALPIEANGQVNHRDFRNLGTGELIERPYADRYEQRFRDRQRSVQLRRSERLMEFPDERTAAYAADACGLGCEGHEGLQVRNLPGTFLAAVVYKALLDDEVLTIQLRFHNDGVQPARLTLDPAGAPESFFVTVGEKTLPILDDEDGELMSKGALDIVLEPGEIESWWARFPAPPAGTTTFDLHIPAVAFHDVPLDTN